MTGDTGRTALERPSALDKEQRNARRRRDHRCSDEGRRDGRDSALDPTGAYCMVAGQDSNDIRLYTIDPGTGFSQALATSVTDKHNGTFMATATTSHLSPFVLFGPNVGTLVPLSFLPAAPAGE